MSPVNQIINPAESTETQVPPLFTAPYIATGAITKGMIVQVVTTYSTSGKPIKVKKATTTENFLIIGVAANTAATGTLVRVITYGPAKVILFTTIASTKADAVLQTGTNAGYAKATATAVLGKTLGVWLETVAGADSVRFAWAYINHM